MRSYSGELLEAIDEQLALARATGCRLQISHLQAAGRANWHLQAQALEKIERAAQEGIDIEFDIYPYLAGSTVLTQVLPQSALDGGTGAMLTRLQDAGQRREIAREVGKRPADSWGDVLITGVRTAGNRDVVGLTVAEIAAQRGVGPVDTVLDLLMEESGEATIISFNQSDDNLLELLTHPRCTVISDGFYVKGRPHPRLFGTFPELLGKVCREKRWMTLEEAVHKITAKPARRFGMKDAGVLRAGVPADITVFDAETVGSPATYSDPEQPPLGIRLVFRKGRQLWPVVS
jgi:dihydroorotase/N-acyl-D-amino-acid deacylase